MNGRLRHRWKSRASLFALVWAGLLSGGCLTPTLVMRVDLDEALTGASSAVEETDAANRKTELVAAVELHETQPAGPTAAGQPAAPPEADQPAVEAPAPALPSASLVPAESLTSGPIVAPSAPTEAATKDIREIRLDIAPPAVLDDAGRPLPSPADYAADYFARPPLTEQEMLTDYSFAAMQNAPGLGFCYQPLYFEEVNVERYGRSHGVLQPLVSAAHFYGRIPVLPYMVFARPARRCTYHPHWALPGYRLPYREQHPPVPSWHGALAETAAVAGLILLIP
jgi:hypothetical protein